MRIRHLMSVVFTIVFFMCVSLHADTLRIPCHFEMPAIMELDGSHLIHMEGLRLLGTVGEPLMPIKTLIVLLPYGQSLSEVRLEIDKQSTLPGIYEIQYQKEIRPIGLPPAGKNRRNEEIYRSSSPYPKEPVHVLGEQVVRGHRVAVVNVCPIRYVPASGRITVITEAHLVIKTQGRSVSSQERKSLRSLSNRIRMENSQALSTYPVQSEGRERPAEYLLITSSRLLPAFLPLLEWKELKGLHCKTALVEEIEASSTGLDLP
ncbi:MAG: C25 family peptidase propeptide domain-containing protein, partial [Armatimonadota bacterium]